MTWPALLGLTALLVALAARWRRHERARQRAVEALAEQVRELSARVEASEEELAGALSSSGVAESLLLEKGIADEDEVEAMRRRLGGDAGPRHGEDAIH